MRATWLNALAVLGLSSCGASPIDGNQNSRHAVSSPANEIYKSPQGVAYKVDRVGDLKSQDLPQNSDLKMVDGDLAKYAQVACTLDVPPEHAPSRCDIYVQPDKTGTLIGYAAVTQTKDGARLSTVTSLNAEKQPRGAATCGIEGLIYGGGGDYTKAIKDASRDFEGQIAYSAWEKDSNNWLVSQLGPNDQGDEQGSTGIWYVKRQGEKLRINQERWNYCYTDTGVYMDDVFTRAIVLVRQPG
ncbi:hypothetical protein [Sphingomonas immobilis]|uniref:Uncharacterized protein n=1 Tax=Sphingomonas immobilis TaxID=3063997 RepID=A0ABT8ZZM1_9SPHN|nr:hypothetical protein [Sphingomonas sp. CA1-15]MDO7842733.1 hypothetical protein [Sphingomonas sp. CA1-15]